MVRINGENMDFSGLSVAEMLALLKLSDTRVAVELNGNIVPRDKYDSTILNDGDTAEVVRFVGGG